MKPSLAKGTRDFSAIEVQKRQYIMNVLREEFEVRGYDPIETPSFEKLETLTGKYGEEGDRLIFKILRSGDFTSKIDEGAWANKDPKALGAKVADKALRYDLTVPFARYVVQHQNEIAFPFKRYQMQPVWRADRPQKGRFREFYQCDADVVGSSALLQEVELMQLYDAVFSDLGLQGVVIHLNNRKILSGIAAVIGAADKLIDFTVALDKLDKIGPEKVAIEMLEKGISQEAVNMAAPLFNLKGTNEAVLDTLSSFLATSAVGQEGVSEMAYVLKALSRTNLSACSVSISVTLARGLNYYTGTILEVSAPEGVSMGSIGGGGRYDNLTAIFGLQNVGGVGISFGLDRIYLVLEALDLFPEAILAGPQVFFVNFGDSESLKAMTLVHKLRKLGISCDLYPAASKVQKQMKYAHQKGAQYVALLGAHENEKNILVLKHMDSGDQMEYSLDEMETIAAIF